MKAVLVGTAVVLAVALVMGVAALAANRVPLADPPGLLPRLAVYLSRNVARTRPGSDFPELNPLVLSGDAHDLVERIAAACRALGWEAVDADPARRRVTAVVRSRLFGFRDDLAAQLVPAGAGAFTLAVHSASRMGRGDLGANTRHVMDLNERLAAQGLVPTAPAP